MQVVNRTEIGLRPARSATKFTAPPLGVVAHWEGITTSYDGSLEDGKKAWRNIQASHLANVKEGYVDIAYNYGITLGGHILEGRGDTIQGGANGTGLANRTYISVCFIMGVNQTLTEAAKAAFLEISSHIGGTKNCHSDFRATACPGDQIRSWIKNDGCKMNGANPTPPPPVAPKPVEPAFPLPSGHWYGTKSANPRNHSGYWEADRPAIRAIQRSVGAVADGIYGEKTKAAVISFQHRNGLAADGLTGLITWSTMF